MVRSFCTDITPLSAPLHVTGGGASHTSNHLPAEHYFCFQDDTKSLEETAVVICYYVNMTELNEMLPDAP